MRGGTGGTGLPSEAISWLHKNWLRHRGFDNDRSALIVSRCKSRVEQVAKKIVEAYLTTNVRIWLYLGFSLFLLSYLSVNVSFPLKVEPCVMLITKSVGEWIDGSEAGWT